MATFTGTANVKGGFYLNVRDWKLEVVQGATGVLPGDAAVRYRRVPLVAMLVLAPLMGMLFVILLPFIGIAVVLEQVWHKVVAPAILRRRAMASAAALNAVPKATAAPRG